MKTDLAEKSFFSVRETIKFYELSARKFYALLKKMNSADFLAYYKKRRLILREPFEEFLQLHPELRKKEL